MDPSWCAHTTQLVTKRDHSPRRVVQGGAGLSKRDHLQRVVPWLRSTRVTSMTIRDCSQWARSFSQSVGNSVFLCTRMCVIARSFSDVCSLSPENGQKRKNCGGHCVVLSLFFSGIWARRARTPPILLRRLVAVILQEASDHVPHISDQFFSLCILATRTLLSCSTRTPDTMVLAFREDSTSKGT